VAELNKAAQQAKKDLQAAADALKKLETRIEDAQPSSSPFGKARDIFRAAEKQHAAARDQALSTPEYKEKYDRAKQADDTSALASLRKQTLEGDATVQATAAKLKQAKGVYEPLRTALLEGDDDWAAANEELQNKKQALKDAEDALRKAIVKQHEAATEAKKAAAAAAAAQAAASADQPPGSHRHHH